MSRRWQIVRVDWLDAHGGNKGGWKDFETAARTKPLPAMSFGILARETKTHITVIPHFVSAREDDFLLETANADAELCIPRTWVRKVTKLGWYQ